MTISIKTAKEILTKAWGAYVEGHGFVRVEINSKRDETSFICLVDQRGFFMCLKEEHNPNGILLVDECTLVLRTNTTDLKVTPLFPLNKTSLIHHVSS